MPFPAYTPCAGGFVTAHPLPDGRTLVEGWTLTREPLENGGPCHDAAYHWITSSDTETTTMIAEFVAKLATLSTITAL